MSGIEDLNPSLVAEVQNLEPSAPIELFDLEMGWGTFYFHAGTNGLGQPVVWQGNSYTPLPITASGFDMSTGGQMPRPKLQLANIDGAFGQLIRDNGDVTGARVTRRRTMAKFLDAVNFPGGNPTADPTAEFPPDVYFIDRKSSENKNVIEFELASAIDLNRVQIPRRQIIQNSCPWVYRGEDCTYTGPAVATLGDVPTSIASLDRCGKRLQSCKLRFGADNPLPYGGFPAAGLMRA